MKIELIDMDEFVSLNKLPEVTDPVVFSKGAVPSPDGALSTEIFGSSIDDRSTIFGYVELNTVLFHPFIYKLLKRVDRRIVNIVNGTKYYVIQDGELVEDEINGSTGIKFLYENWDKIKFSRNESYMRGERINVLETHKKNVIFVSKWVLSPPFYRDVNFGLNHKGRLSHNELTDMYAKLIRYSKVIGQSNTFDFVQNTNIGAMQEHLVEIFNHIQEKLARKRGMIRKRLMSKYITYGSRLVISAPVYHAETPEETTVDFKTCGIPLAQCCSLFAPFMIKWVRDYFRREFVTSGVKYMARDSKGDIVAVELDDPEGYFNDEFILKRMNHFIKTPDDRFNPIEVPIKGDKGSKMYFSFTGRSFSTAEPSSTIGRYATWTDIFYQAAVDITSNKHVYITRFPVTDYFGTFANRIFVMSTTETTPVMIGEKVFKHYPVVEVNNKKLASTGFIDTLRISNMYLIGLGGDYDGDQVSVKAVFSEEANAEAEKIINSPANIFNIAGGNMRRIENESIQTLYGLTKE